MNHDAPSEENQACGSDEAAGLNAGHGIFRTDALRKYSERHAKAVLPQSPVPAWAVLVLWILLALAAAGGMAAWLAASTGLDTSGQSRHRSIESC
jgi:hypothetical protein